jgi:biotin transporter BioY
LHPGLSQRLRQFDRKSIIGQLVLVVIGLELLIFTSFIAVPLPTATGANLRAQVDNVVSALILRLPYRMQQRIEKRYPSVVKQAQPVRFSAYVPEAPVAIFLGYVLGMPLGLAATGLFLLLGLVGPLFELYLFAEGGGLSYYMQPSAGYLVGLFAAAWVSSHFAAGERSTIRQLTMICLGLLYMHGIGLLYLAASVMTGGVMDGLNGYPAWAGWLSGEARNLSWYALPWDFVFSFILIGIAVPFRWLTDALTSPDIFERAKPAVRLEE